MAARTRIHHGTDDRCGMTRAIALQSRCAIGWRQVVRSGVVSLVIGWGGFLGAIAPATALPPPEDTPEEILRTEIILEARSPVDGEPLTASEYVELQAELADAEYPPSVNPETQQLIFLLRIRRVLNIVLPFQVF